MSNAKGISPPTVMPATVACNAMLMLSISSLLGTVPDSKNSPAASLAAPPAAEVKVMLIGEPAFIVASASGIEKLKNFS